MDRAQLLLLGLPLFLFCSDLISLFSPPPPKPPHGHHHHHQPPPQSQQRTVVDPGNIELPSEKLSGLGGVGLGNTVQINFCASCSYRGTATNMRTMLLNQFPGLDVALANYPPPLPKRLLSKVVPVVQIGVVAVVVAGEHIFPMLGYVAPPPWYFNLRANKFGTIASTWLLGNTLQSFLQSSGAFEVYFNGDLVFSKLKEGRFPGEIELKELVGRKMANARFADGVTDLLS
ncbi:hypothetical protein K1719_028053 [Acacia pycnantha]|nr:hypothetical protein K1719_028053 [Acacia pycnantha]